MEKKMLPASVLEVAMPIRWLDVSLIARGPTVPARGAFEAFDCTVLVMARTGARVWVDVPFELASQEWTAHLRALERPREERAELMAAIWPMVPGIIELVANSFSARPQGAAGGFCDDFPPGSTMSSPGSAPEAPPSTPRQGE